MAFNVADANLSKLCYLQVSKMFYFLVTHQLSRLSVGIAKRTQVETYTPVERMFIPYYILSIIQKEKLKKSLGLRIRLYTQLLKHLVRRGCMRFEILLSFGVQCHVALKYGTKVWEHPVASILRP
jgi:hypothetical protein